MCDMKTMGVAYTEVLPQALPFGSNFGTFIMYICLVISARPRVGKGILAITAIRS